MPFQESLSEREKQVAAHIAAGLRVAGVANELGLAENTVRNHLRTIFSKLDVHSQSELIDYLRDRSSIVSPYRAIAGLSTGPVDMLSRELEAVDRAAVERITACAVSDSGVDVMKAIMRSVLPLDEERRREWRVRLATHVVAPHQRTVRDAAAELREHWAKMPLLRIRDYQTRGWIRDDIDAEEVRRRLFAAVYAAVLALLADSSPAEERRQLDVIDRILQELAPEGGNQP